MTLEVDAREAPRKIFHSRLSLPASPGPLTLAYPKWIPGEHGPTGPIADLTGLTITAGGKPLAWRRDPVDMYSFHLDVPAGASAVEVSLDYLSPAEAGGFSSGSSATAELALISWNQMLLYPAAEKPDTILYAATLKLPAGWKFATALDREKESPDGVRFAPVSLTTLVDSPVLCGAHMRVVDLSTGAPAHRLDIAADSDAALEISPEMEAQYRSLVVETGTLYGARHYRHYDFLLTLSDHTAHFGLEHHESSDDRVDERSLIDDDRKKIMAGLLPHEMTHSWNGKYRRPAGLAIGSFQEPMQGELLWVYEGLTEYLGQILTARSGLLTADQYREALALTAAEMDHQEGRKWRLSRTRPWPRRSSTKRAPTGPPGGGASISIPRASSCGSKPTRSSAGRRPGRQEPGRFLPRLLRWVERSSEGPALQLRRRDRGVERGGPLRLALFLENTPRRDGRRRAVERHRRRGLEAR